MQMPACVSGEQWNNYATLEARAFAVGCSRFDTLVSITITALCCCAQVVVDEALLEEVLGPRRFLGHDAEHRVAGPGSVAGLVWTEAGGQVQYIECAATSAGRPGHRGVLQLTGQVRCSKF